METMTNTSQKILKTGHTLSPLVLRLALGVVIFPHGAQKVLGWFGGHGLEGTLGFLTQTMGLPTIVALAVIFGEFFGSLALIAGVLTRLSAAGIFAIMAGAVATVHWKVGFFMNWSGNQSGEGFEFHLLAMGIAVALMTTGGGRYALDHWLSKLLSKKTGAAHADTPQAVSTH